MDTKDKEKQEVALARFAAIAPVINGTCAEASAASYYRRIAGEPLISPGGLHRYYSARTYEDWVRKYKKCGIDALFPKGRSDAGHCRKLSEDAISSLYVLKNRFPKMNATMMYEKLIEDGIIKASEVSLSTVQRFAKSAFFARSKGSEGKDRRAFVSERVNGIWQADTLFGPYIGKPAQRIYIQTIIDDRSRLIVASRAYKADNSASFQATLKSAIARYGLPEKLYVDNGSAYRNDQLAMIAGRLGIVLLHAPVKDGAAKGKIERANRTLRTRFLSMLEAKDALDLDAFSDALSSFVARYNTTVHSSTEKRPLDSFSAEAHLLRRAPSEKWLDECFLNRTTRKVSADCTVKIEKRDFDCPGSYSGMRIEVRYDPLDLSSIIIFDDKERIVCFPTDREANANTKRQKPLYGIDYRNTGERGDEGDVLPLLQPRL